MTHRGEQTLHKSQLIMLQSANSEKHERLNYWVELETHREVCSPRGQRSQPNGSVYALSSGSESLGIVQSSLNDLVRFW